MTGFAYEEGRWEPPIAGDEGATSLGCLERQRATFAWNAVDWGADPAWDWRSAADDPLAW